MAKIGLWDRIRMKKARIKAGSGEKMRKSGEKGAPTAKALKESQSKKNAYKIALKKKKKKKENSYA